MAEIDLERELVDRALAREPAAVRALVDALSPVVERAVKAALWRKAPGLEARGALDDQIEELTLDVFLSLFAADGRALRAWDPARGMPLDRFVSVLARHQVAAILRTGRARPWRDTSPYSIAADRLTDLGPEVGALLGSRAQLRALYERVQERLSPRELELFQRLVVDDEPLANLGGTTVAGRETLLQWKARLLRLVREVAAELDGLAAPAGAAGTARQKGNAWR